MIAMIKEDKDGQIWFNEEYVKQQKERSYWEGFNKGVRIEFHSIVPQNDEEVSRCIKNFYEHINDIIR